MSLMEHLEELRSTLIRVVLILLISFSICYSFGDYISELLLRPLRGALSGESIGGEIVYLGLLDKILSQLQVAFWSSVLISAPLWFIEIWKFVRPGLYDHEAKMVGPFVFVGFIFFALGVSFGYFIVFPFTFETLLSFGVQNVTATISLKEYLVLTSKVLVFLGIIFQLPNALLILGFMGLVTKYSLREIRPYVFVGLAIVSAILTPPDPYTLLGIWLPMIILYELGIIAVAFIVHPYLAKVHTPKENEE